jgi:exosortase
LILCVLAVIVYWPIVRDLLHVWSEDPNYSHGFLVAPFALGVVWWKRDSLAAAVAPGSWWGAVILVAGLVVLVAGTAVEAVGSGRGGLFVKAVSIVPVAIGATLFVAGRRVAAALLFPVLYLLFMVPLPVGVFAMLTLPLQLYASSAATVALELAGILAMREGNLIHLSGLTMGVTEACSGIRSLLTLGAGGVALTWLLHHRWWQHAVLVASIVPLALVMNVLRISGTGVIAALFSPAIAEGFFHSFSSWLIITIASALLWGEGAMLVRIESDLREARA